MEQSPDEEEFEGRLLHQAALWDAAELVEELVTADPNIVHSVDAHGRTALHAAALTEKSKALPALLSASMKPPIDAISDAQTGSKTALHVCAERGHEASVRALLAAGADSTLRDVHHRTPAQLAVLNHHYDVATVIRKHEEEAAATRAAKHIALREAVGRVDASGLRALLATLPPGDAELLVNMTPAGANTLLYQAAELGSAECVAILVEAGADGRAHPVTGYCPLYAACYRGHKEAARLLLRHFPEQASVASVERWTPLHAASISSHPHIVTLLLKHAYPQHMLQTFTDASGRWRYRFAWDVNATDASGQSALYIASTLGAADTVSALLAHTEPAEPTEHTQLVHTKPEIEENADVVSSRNGRGGGVSRHIRALVTKLTGGSRAYDTHIASQNMRVRVVRCDVGRGLDSCVAAAARGDHVATLKALLDAGADPDSRALPPQDLADDEIECWSALCAAARARSMGAVETLVNAGATDARSLARRELTALTHPPPPSHVLSALLATRASEDGEHRINRGAVTEVVLRTSEKARVSGTERTYSALAPATPVAVSWRDMQPPLTNIQLDWLCGCARRLNSRLSSAVGPLALAAITRLDLANNELKELPSELFSMISLRIFNAAGNKLERLPEDASAYNAPVLSELQLADNRLEFVPYALFSLRSLGSLDVSNNKLRELPAQMWSAPALTDLNAALNHLRDLPPPLKQDERAPPTLTPPRDDFDSDGEEDWEIAMAAEAERAQHAVCASARRAHVWRGAVEAAVTGNGAEGITGSRLVALNLAHNALAAVPMVLACAAPRLQRLNLSYNSLRSMSHVTSYPPALRQLDLSHNQITCWPSLPQMDGVSGTEDDPLRCYCASRSGSAAGPATGEGMRARLLAAACPARRHLRLDALRTLIVSNNLLTRVQLTTDAEEEDSEDEEHLRARLVFPALSMLDVSCNMLRSLPSALRHLQQLAVLNVAQNAELAELPSALGTLPRLWSVGAAGCALRGELASLAAGRSAALLAFLRARHHDARPYSAVRLMLVGEAGVGKTSLLRCLQAEGRHQPSTHWAERMGGRRARGNLSTVGVDIGTWQYQRITFRTWDFGGQHEYYATHAYFLSRRALYLVVWHAARRPKALVAALHWLRCIQARAPGASVILVATHYDQVADKEELARVMRALRAELVLGVDNDKRGLPRVIDLIEVSCSTRHNISALAELVAGGARGLRGPGGEPLLGQRVPAQYLQLEECMTMLPPHIPPVLTHTQYVRMVREYMASRRLRPFRDDAELQHATAFLHDNGVILHYGDAILRALYFVRPQWLSDLLAHVLAVREVNPYPRHGVMRTDEVRAVLSALPAVGGEECGAVGLALLHKFELALSWDARTLLLPALLPIQPPLVAQLPLRTVGSGRAWVSPPTPPLLSTALPPRDTDSPTLVHEGEEPMRICLGADDCDTAVRRVWALAYVPAGLWARLVARIAGDDALATAARALYQQKSGGDGQWWWWLWAGGAKLAGLGGVTLLSLRLHEHSDPLIALADPARQQHESHTDDETYQPYSSIRWRVWSEGAWSALGAGAGGGATLALHIPAHTVRTHTGGVCEASRAGVARLLALVTDHVDQLLEDWYPALGTRGVATTSGRWLVTRLVPCPRCFHAATEMPPPPPPFPNDQDEETHSDRDSGVGCESNTSSSEGILSARVGNNVGVTAWTVEQCVWEACSGGSLVCPHHPNVSLAHVAPDTMLVDVEPGLLARWDQLTVRKVLGRGAFGTVVEARWTPPKPRMPDLVALKALQPTPALPHDAHHKAWTARWERDSWGSAARAYGALRAELRVLRSLAHPHVVALRGVCAAPLALLLERAARGALDAALREYRARATRLPERALRALALQVARALEYLHARRIVYRDLKTENVLVWRLPSVEEAREVDRSPDPVDVLVKLADYGISRVGGGGAAGAVKGFGGTEGYMAPEIARHNGEEEYNEKVDVFSYGMLLYEALTARAPFAHVDSARDALLAGDRPALTPQEVGSVGASVLELVAACWAGAPEQRPAAAALAALCAAPELLALRDAASPRAAPPPRAAAAAAVTSRTAESRGWEVWWGGGEPECLHALSLTDNTFSRQHTVRLPPESTRGVAVTAVCVVGSRVWAGDSAARVNIYDARSMRLVRCVRVNAVVGGSCGAVSALKLLPPPGGRVALAMQCGRLFVVSAEEEDASSSEGEDGGFVLTELGAATELTALALTQTLSGEWELWAGGDSLSVYVWGEGGVCGADVVWGAGRTALLAAGPGGTVLQYAAPGGSVVQWAKRERTGRTVDVSRLAPSSERAADALPPPHTTVTSLCVCGEELLVGTDWGCVVVVDAQRLVPLTVCRPHTADVAALVPLGDIGAVSLGAGYRPLLPRYTHHHTDMDTEEEEESDGARRGAHALLWRAARWLPH